MILPKQHAKDFGLSADVPICATTGEKFDERPIKASSAFGISCGATQSALMLVLTVITFMFM